MTIDPDELRRKAVACTEKWRAEGAEWEVATAVPVLLDELARLREENKQIRLHNEGLAEGAAYSMEQYRELCVVFAERDKLQAKLFAVARDNGHLRQVCKTICREVQRAMDQIKGLVSADVYHTLAAVATDTQCRELLTRDEAERDRLRDQLAAANQQHDHACWQGEELRVQLAASAAQVVRLRALLTPFAKETKRLADDWPDWIPVRMGDVYGVNGPKDPWNGATLGDCRRAAQELEDTDHA